MKIIAKEQFVSLTKGKEYDVVKEFKHSYNIKDDSGYISRYYKDYFDIVEENYFKVVAKETKGGLTKGKDYTVLEDSEYSYRIINDIHIEGYYCKHNFDIVEETPSHYDNSNGSLYLFAEQQNLNPWEFDIIKRIVRSRKKGNFIEDLEKTKVVIDLYLKEYEIRKT